MFDLSKLFAFYKSPKYNWSDPPGFMYKKIYSSE